MRIPVERLIDGVVQTLTESVLPDLATPFARGQLYAAVDVLKNLRDRVEPRADLADAESDSATAALAGALAVEPDAVLLTNGGAEAIALVGAQLGRAAVDPCEFSLYARHLERIDPTGPRIRSNPHNPTGRLAPPDVTAAVWDEAFYPLATGRWTSGAAALGAVAIGSLTKVFACPGLRIGYVVAAPETIADLATRQPRWSVNAIAAALVPELVGSADLDAWCAATARRRAALTAAIPGVEPSDASYVLVRAPGGARAWREHLARRGVLVRDCTSFGLADHVRVAVPDERGLERLAAAWTA